MALSLKVDWEAAQRAVENGASYAQVSLIFGIDPSTLRKRASRFKWLVPERVEKALESGHKAHVAGMTREGRDAAKNEADSMVLAALAGTWATRGVDQRNMAFKLAHDALKKATPAPLVKWSDVEIADRIARKAAGLESGDAQIQIAVLPSGWPTAASEMGGNRGQSVDTEAFEMAEGDGTLVPSPSDAFDE